ncbi:MAG: hypothetical protein JXA52_00480 [Planctomycetes bacterium]|nr:hypothetical protein [Planctomycetota bacterium]
MANKYRKTLLRLLLVLLVLFVLLTAYTFHVIYRDVKAITGEAKDDFGLDDPVLALIALLESEEYSYQDRNRAVWALGQIGDKRALPPLEILNLTVPAGSKGFSQEFSKYGIEKAIQQLNSSFIVTRWMYRDL